jgi:serine/threonine protein kinase/Tfp pilus assembly protein PilF
MSSDSIDSQWQLKKELFQAACEMSPLEQQQFLDTRIQSDSIRDEVNRLLRLHRSGDSFLKSPLETQLPAVPDHSPPLDRYIGQSTGEFRIQRLLGVGGMGAVYLARQKYPDRNVALKILDQRPHQSERRIQRFVHEITVLARLDHPGIAKIYSAGGFDFGRGLQSWFAMELVSGVTLGSYLELTAPNLEEKLDLLIQICQAVHHAHLRGVVHRDLKPSNILVAWADRVSCPTGENQPDGSRDSKSSQVLTKIVDFGIARITDDSNQSLTVDGEILGTLDYMSPEQLAGKPEQVDGRSDVFSIGMIGFEMLTGSLAYQRRGQSLSNMISRASIDPPARLRELVPSASRDLELIFATAVAQDPQQRYVSARDLALDLQRFLNHERPLVREPSVFYRTRRLVSQHRGLFFGTLATMAGLAVGMIFYAGAAGRANQNATELKYEVDKAQAINDFIANDLVMRFLGVSAASNKPRNEMSQLVGEASQKISTMFRGQPINEAAIRNEIGTIFYNLQDYEKADAEYSKAKALWETNLGNRHNDTLKAVNNLGQSYLTQGKLEQAAPLLEEAYRGRLATLGPDHTLTINSKINLANLYMNSQRLAEAEQMLTEVLAQRTDWGQDSDKSILAAMANLGVVHLRHGRVDEALRLHQKSYEIGVEHYGEGHPTTIRLAMRLAQTLLRAGKVDDADKLVQNCLPRLRALTGADSPETVAAVRLLSRICRSQGDLKKALLHLREAERVLLAGKRNDVQLKKIQSEIEALQLGKQ